MAKDYPSFQEVQNVREKFKNISYQHWVNDDLFTWKWWFLLFLSIFPWIVWWKIVDKRRLPEILMFGLIMATFAFLLDNIGTDLMWWEYPDKLLQMIPPLLPADLTLVPCIVMLIYQWTKTWKSFLLVNFIVSLWSVYLGETFFIWLDLYKLLEWKLIYSVLFYNIGGTIARWLVLKTFSISKKAH